MAHPRQSPLKNSSASTTVMSSTSAIDLPLNSTPEGLVALALADVAGDVDVGQEVHLDLDDAVAPVASSQRPPLTLNEYRPVAARFLDSGRPANHPRGSA